MLTERDIQDAQGMKVIDLDGNKIGKVEAIYLDDDTDQPEFALVDTGLLPGRSNFVPLSEATRTEDAIRVPYDKDRVKGAPDIPADDELSRSDEAELYRHYGVDTSGTAAPDTPMPSPSSTQTSEDMAGRYELSDPQESTTVRPAPGAAAGPAPDATTPATVTSEPVHSSHGGTRGGRDVRLRRYVVTEIITEIDPDEGVEGDRR